MITLFVLHCVHVDTVRFSRKSTFASNIYFNTNIKLAETLEQAGQKFREV